MAKVLKELANRFRHWVDKTKQCNHCCLCCEYYKTCKDDC